MFLINQRTTRDNSHNVGLEIISHNVKLKPIIYQPKVSEYGSLSFNNKIIGGKTVEDLPIALGSVREKTKTGQERKEELKVLFNRTRDRYDKTFRDLVNL